MVRFWTTACVAVCLAVAGVGGAEARSLADTLRRTGMSQEDINVMSEAAGVLYRQGTPKVGQSVEWTNPDSGTSGTSTLQSFENKCATLRHVVVTTRRPEPQDFLFRQCQTATGTWILTP